jgi:AbrB family looped-hinge helix DNA binding protein
MKSASTVAAAGGIKPLGHVHCAMHLTYLIGVPSMIVLPVRLEAGIMNRYATTKLSSKGQVVIPEEVRNDLGLNEGDQFVVIGQGDAVILKVITPPKLEEFRELLNQARSEAKRAGVKKADLRSAIARVRRQAK